ncbi:MAG: DUF192 domain-containing protein [Paraglaciecola chathamensis]|jgi:uncharacterized membrane protein (UPF0127 family)|uniref:Exported protein n=1 Tax=Paraglaciecola agarilytica NO2 TaxID=1125747 RepID=A0ABQ0I321_9ALTE|nr:DUF192 domain-containing protein [Paraglaciecola agarilytica]GAC03715.1 exported protein [Paraglaciecola agarilytica NO2]
MTFKFLRLFCCVLLVGSFTLPIQAVNAQEAKQHQTLPTVKITLQDIPLEVEYAHTFEQRAMGLMYRKTLCEQCGMLFKFSGSKKASMWMQNTFLALDVAFITSDGVITDIKPMQPHDLTSVGASEAVLYALEMNQGWFAKNGIKVGDKMVIKTP